MVNKKEELKRNLLFYFSHLFNWPLVTPDYLMLSITDRCNLRCVMCGVPNGTTSEKELTVEEIKNIIKEATNIFGFVKVTLSGGEPFLRNDIFEIIKYIHENKLTVDINTNGILINDDIAEKIIEAKINSLTISLDGATAKTNDSIRGSGVYSKIISAINSLNNIKKGNVQPYINISYTIMDANVHEIKDIIGLALQLNCSSVSFQPVIGDNTQIHKKNDNPLFISMDHLELLSNLEESIHSSSKHINVYYPSTAMMCSYFTGSSNPRKWNCFAGYNRISISAIGEIYTCQGSFGNIRRNSIKDIWYGKKAYYLRKQIKTCERNCLQLCYARPESESLWMFLKNFVKNK